MKGLHPIASLAVGAVLGVSVAFLGWILIRASPAPAAGNLSNAAPANSQALATQLMARIAPRFVATEAPSKQMGDGVVFYDQPRPYGDALCRIRSYAFAGRVVAGHPELDDHRPIENLTVSDLYGVWTEPGTPEARVGDRNRACAQFRDFDHLISGEDGDAVERATTVLAGVIRASRSGRLQFKIVCLDRRRELPSNACDGPGLLREMSIRDVLSVEPIWRDYRWGDPVYQQASGATYLDLIQLRAPERGRACGQTETLIVRLETRQTFGRHSSSEGDPVSLMMWRDVIC